jgi:hypothetical protein
MNDLLWLVNHPLQGNVVGIPTSWNPDTLDGLKNRLSVGIHRILAELLHPTKPELRILRWTQTDFDWASTLGLLQGLSTSRDVLWPSDPCLSPTLQEWTWEHYRGLNLTLFTLSTGGEGSTMVFIGVRLCCGRRLGAWGPLDRPTSHAT